MKKIAKTDIEGARELTPVEMNRMHFASEATKISGPLANVDKK